MSEDRNQVVCVYHVNWKRAKFVSVCAAGGRTDNLANASVFTPLEAVHECIEQEADSKHIHALVCPVKLSNGRPVALILEDGERDEFPFCGLVS